MGLINYIEKKRIEREKAIRNERIVDSLKFLGSIGAGFTLGLLFAKKSGKETRKDISNVTKEGLNYIGENLNNAKNYIKDKVEDVKEKVIDKAEDVVEKVKDKTEDVKEKVKDKTEDVGEKVKDKAEDVKEKIKK